MRINLRRSFLVTRMDMQSSLTRIMTTMTATTKDASQALGLFGTHKCKLTTSKSLVLKQGQTSALVPLIWSLKRVIEFNLVIFCKNKDLQINTSGIRI
jgi:hypothetical protein